MGFGAVGFRAAKDAVVGVVVAGGLSLCDGTSLFPRIVREDDSTPRCREHGVEPWGGA